MIPLSPLQLKRHFFSVLNFRANPKGTSTAAVSMEPLVHFAPLPTMPNHWALGLRLAIKSCDAESPYFYEVEVEAQGMVEINESIPAEKREQLAAVNGLSPLYSAIRELLLNISARSAHGLVGLPVLNFSQIVAAKTAVPKPIESNTSKEAESIGQ